MKKRVIMAIIAMAIGTVCYANDLTTNKHNQDNPEKNTITDTISDCSNHESHEHEIDGYPCPCSKFTCRQCGGTLEISATAYKKYNKKKCHKCNGKGCVYCDGTGHDWNWVTGCKCKRCGKGYKQPNDC